MDENCELVLSHQNKTIMRIKTKSTLIISGFMLITSISFGQEMCTNVVKTSNPSAMFSYLSAKYGEENTEQLVINIQDYEIENNVTVLCESDFKNTISRFSELIEGTSDLDEKNRLLERKARFILLNTIEEIIQ